MRGYCCSNTFFLFLEAITKAASVGSPFTRSADTVQLLHNTAKFNINSGSVPLKSNACSLSAISTTVILFCVSVPVLSEQITLAPQCFHGRQSSNNCTIGNHSFNTHCQNNGYNNGKPSGIAATAKLMEIINISNGDICWNNPKIKIRPQMIRAPMPKTLLVLLNDFAVVFVVFLPY